MASRENDPLTRLVRSDLRVFQAYDAVDPPEVLAQRAGIPEDQVIKLNGNENPYGPSPRLTEGLANWPGYHIYPDPLQRRARAALAEYVGLGEQHIVAGAGADEIIDLLVRATLEPGDRVVNCTPTFGMYSFSTAVQGGRTVSTPRDSDYRVDIDACLAAVDDGAKIVFNLLAQQPERQHDSSRRYSASIGTGRPGGRGRDVRGVQRRDRCPLDDQALEPGCAAQPQQVGWPCRASSRLWINVGGVG